ncbi:MAG TPA: 50S ribosomal protein L35 [Verrucomicrobiae bacterium]|jgi:large subunit ribosomal protein L35|nr:50S ribosomal protein L35 [Verrucomicrobiae bacterium]
MPKMKTCKAVKKRFRVTKNGKVLMSKALKRHLLGDRTSKKKRQNRGWHAVDKSDAHRVKWSMPYGLKGQ